MATGKAGSTIMTQLHGMQGSSPVGAVCVSAVVDGLCMSLSSLSSYDQHHLGPGIAHIAV